MASLNQCTQLCARPTPRRRAAKNRCRPPDPSGGAALNRPAGPTDRRRRSRCWRWYSSSFWPSASGLAALPDLRWRAVGDHRGDRRAGGDRRDLRPPGAGCAAATRHQGQGAARELVADDLDLAAVTRKMIDVPVLARVDPGRVSTPGWESSSDRMTFPHPRIRELAELRRQGCSGCRGRQAARCRYRRLQCLRR